MHSAQPCHSFQLLNPHPDLICTAETYASHAPGYPQASAPHAWPCARQQPGLGRSSPCTCGHSCMGMPCSLQAFSLACQPAPASSLFCLPGLCFQLPQQHGLAQHPVDAPLVCFVPGLHALLAHQQMQVPLSCPKKPHCWLCYLKHAHAHAQRRLAYCRCLRAEHSQQAPGPAVVQTLLLKCQCPQQHLSCHAAKDHCMMSEHVYQR